jgi:hypothetical protein
MKLLEVEMTFYFALWGSDYGGKLDEIFAIFSILNCGSEIKL